MEILHKDKAHIDKLSEFMYRLTDEDNKKDIVEAYQDTINNVRPIDLFYVKMYREKSQRSPKVIKETANKFVNVFYKSLSKYALTEHPHPFFDGLLKENEAIIKHLEGLKKYFKGDTIETYQEPLLKGLEKCLEFEKKWLKKENILFPNIEASVPSHKPLDVMWSLHDDARTQLKHLIKLFTKKPLDIKTIKPLIGTYYYLIYGIIQKESLILFPVASKILDDSKLDKMFKESFQFGFTFVEIQPPLEKNAIKDKLRENVFRVPNGQLDFKQLDLMLNHLPLDITFVDKDDRVAYFNTTAHRHFPRNPSVIGRLVEHCHPPKSVDTVKKIVQSFKEGTKDEAEFYIQFKDKFLYITYYAVRDDNNDYQGVLEVSQDVTHLRNLKGEKRLLDW